MEASPRLIANIQEMQQYFPNFTFSTEKVDGIEVAAWRGRVQPIQSVENLAELLDDIHFERPAQIIAGGQVRHHPDCLAIHKQHTWLGKLNNLDDSYDLVVKYDGGKAHPKAFIHNLVIPSHGPKHLFENGLICPYAPWEEVWLWERDTVVDYLGHAVTWLVKWMVWCQAAIWLGPEFAHEPAYLIRTIERNQECWCGSGKKYKRCHLPDDERRARCSPVK